MSSRTLLPLILGMLIGLALATLTRFDVLHAQQANVFASPARCSVTLAFGPLRGMWDSWLVFEDGKGTLRAIDDRCRVRQVIDRP